MKGLNSPFEEVLKCKNDVTHFIKKYVVDFKLDERQLKYLENLASGNDCQFDESIENVFQELNLAFALWKMIFCPYMSIVFMSKDKETRNLLANKFREMLNRIALFEVKLTKNLKHEISFSNNSTIFFGDYESYECQLCGRCMSILILDDFKTFENKQEFIQSVVPIVKSCKRGQIIQSN